MRLRQLVCGELQVNAYIVGADDTNEVVVIDPGAAQPVLDALEAERLSCVRILLTHGHFDHIGGVRELRAKTGASICIHEADADMLSSNRMSLAVLTGGILQPTQADVLFHGGETFDSAGLSFRVLHTPGHTKGGVSYALDKERVVFCGDTLFCDGVGRTDFPGGSQKELYASIVGQLYTLGDDYTAYCGHEEPTTIERERKYNPFTRQG